MMPLDPAGPPYRPSCGGSKEVGIDYDIKLHLASLLVLLVTSSAAAYAPIYIRYLIKKNALTEIASNTFQWALWATKHFGTGVIIGTAFIHILPAAHSYLTAPCLPPFFTTDYPSLPDAIAMAAMFAIFLIDFSSKSWVESLHDQATADAEKNAGLSEEYEAHISNPSNIDRSLYQPEENGSVLISSYRHASKEVAPNDMGVVHHDDLLTINQTPPLTGSEIAEIADMDAHQVELRYHRQQELLSTLIVEAGTCFHSIFLGLSLALSTGDGFTALFIAIVFHQVFEGLAIGSRLASIDLDNHNSKDWSLWVCSTIYGITTPMGVAIGIAVRQDYDLASERSLILTGVFDSMSAGFLLYGGLVGLLSRDFLQ
ncbi:Zinc/iron permease [Morchella snyderi]|nr:Zinc/iron permease [Morchella snyderi]